MNEEHDLVLCVSFAHRKIARKAIRSLLHFSAARKLYLITPIKCFGLFKRLVREYPSIVLLDEADLIGGGVDIEYIRDIYRRRAVNEHKATWYFQQFLKMAACQLPNISDHYLVWDSDTIMLKPLTFFNKDGQVFVRPMSEDHQPYFDTMKKLIDLPRQVDFSFISEHFMVNKAYMQQLVGSLGESAGEGEIWVDCILGAISDELLSAHAFSEYETYGNYLAKHYQQSYVCRSLKATRFGAKMYGPNPSKHDLLDLLDSGFCYASFERWHRTSKGVIGRKVKSRVRFLQKLIFGRHSKEIKSFRQICR